MRTWNASVVHMKLRQAHTYIYKLKIKTLRRSCVDVGRDHEPAALAEELLRAVSCWWRKGGFFL